MSLAMHLLLLAVQASFLRKEIAGGELRTFIQEGRV